MIWLKYDAIYWNQTNTDDLVRMGIDNSCQAFIVTPNSAIDFLTSFENVRFTANTRFYSTHIVALPTSHDKTQEYIERILNHPTVQDIPNILIFSPSSRDIDDVNTKGISFDLITSKFVGRNNNTDPRLLDTFEVAHGSFYKNADLFPDKFADLQGRVIRIALVNYSPYFFWKEVPAGQGNANALDSDEEKTLSIDGTEGYMVLLFCQLYNCTLSISVDEESQWGVINDNMTGIGMLGAIVERRVDMGFSGLWVRLFPFLDFSSVLSQSGSTCICPKPRQLSGWLLPAQPFSSFMWKAEIISFMGTFIALTVIRFVMKKIKSIRVKDTGTTCMEVLAVFILQSTEFGTKHRPEMMVSGIALLTSFLIANAYSGGLSSIMTVPKYETPIDTVHQLAESNLEWGGIHGSWVYAISDAKEPDLVKLVKNSVAIPFEKLIIRRTTRDFCFAIERTPYGHYAVGDYINEEALNYLRLMLDDIYLEYNVAISYKTWPFKGVLDLFILHVAESGLRKYWESQTLTQRGNSKIQLGISISRQREQTGPIGLSLDHLSGTFVLWGFGICCSAIAFIFELIFHRLTREKNIIYFEPYGYDTTRFFSFTMHQK